MLNETMKYAITMATVGRCDEDKIEKCESCYNWVPMSSLWNIYNKEEDRYRFCDDCFDKEPKVYIEDRGHYFKDSNPQDN